MKPVRPSGQRGRESSRRLSARTSNRNELEWLGGNLTRPSADYRLRKHVDTVDAVAQEWSRTTVTNQRSLLGKVALSLRDRERVAESMLMASRTSSRVGLRSEVRFATPLPVAERQGYLATGFVFSRVQTGRDLF